MVTDIERIADQASDIAEITLHLHPEGTHSVGVMDDLNRMGEIALRMVKERHRRLCAGGPVHGGPGHCQGR